MESVDTAGSLDKKTGPYLVSYLNVLSHGKVLHRKRKLAVSGLGFTVDSSKTGFRIES